MKKPNEIASTIILLISLIALLGMPSCSSKHSRSCNKHFIKINCNQIYIDTSSFFIHAVFKISIKNISNDSVYFFSNFSDEIKNNYSNFYLIDSINEACKVGLGPSHFKLAPGEKISKLPGVLSECFLSRDVGKRYDNNNSVAILNFLRNSRFVYVSDRRDFDSRKLKYSFFTGDTIKVSFSNNLKISYFIPYLKEFLDDSIR